MYNLFIKKKLFAKYPYLPKSVLYNIQTLPEGMTSGSGSYERNSFVTVSAIAPNGFRFLNWTEDGEVVSTKPNYIFIINSNRELVANFEESTYTVTTSVNPTGAGTTTGSGTYAHEENVTVTASPKSGYQFLTWTENNNIASRNKQYSFKITKDRNLVANFELLSYNVTTSVNPENAGTTTGAGTYNDGDSVTVNAIPKTGYKFTKWTENGTQVSTNSQYSFTITSNRSLVANFEYQIEELGKKYLIFQALDDNCEIKFNTESALISYDINLQYSIDKGNTWESMPYDGVTINKDEYILFNKGKDIQQTRALQIKKIGTFEVSKDFKALGHPYCLITNDFNEDTVINKNTPSYVFRELFKNCTTLQSVPENFLFAKYVVPGIYASMFLGCSSLITAPKLPATLSVDDDYLECYYGMFSGCTNLINGPTISLNLFEILSHYCTFASMFNGCKNLTSIKFNGTDTSFGNSFGFGEVDGIFQYWVNGITTTGILTVTNDDYLDIFENENYKNIHGVPQNWSVKWSPEVTVTPGTPGTPQT